MNEPEIIAALADILTPALNGTQHLQLADLCGQLPGDHPLAALSLALHAECARLYPEFAALCQRVDAGGDPAPEEWMVAVDAGREQQFTWALFCALLRERFAEAERTVARHVESGIYERRTAEAVLDDTARSLAAHDGALLSGLFPAVTARAVAKGDA